LSTDIYASDPHAASDAEFEPGTLRHLVVGNRGRLLDARRTPITITAVTPLTGDFELEIDAFEDAGARWQLALQEVKRFQFARASQSASAAEVGELRKAAASFDRELVVDAVHTVKQATLSRIAAERRALRDVFGEARCELDVERAIAQREGDDRLYKLLDHYMTDRGVADLDQRFARTFVSNPRSGEFVKGHAVVLAELGLCPYRGQVVRDPTVFAAENAKSRRAAHLVARLSFTQELWATLGYDTVPLYRGTAAEGPLHGPAAASFVSATFSREVAGAHFAGGPTTTAAALWRQDVAVARLLMTFLETAEMNRRFKEAEAILIGDPANRVF
jgi:hypothetical protein